LRVEPASLYCVGSMKTPLVLSILLLLAGGCGVQRTLTITSEPAGALVYLNGTEVGRTPMIRAFTWYGVYNVELRKEGYDTLKTRGKVMAPWWQWVPIDFFAELLPFRPHDRQALSYALTPTEETAGDPEVMVKRAGEMRDQLESSPRTRGPTTQRQ
jgi:hypothetical protein